MPLRQYPCTAVRDHVYALDTRRAADDPDRLQEILDRIFGRLAVDAVAEQATALASGGP